MNKNHTFVGKEKNTSKIIRYLIVAFLSVLVIGVVWVSMNQSNASPSIESASPTPTETVTVSPTPAPKASEPISTTVSRENALRSAENYVDTIPLSKKGLVKQLEFEGFSEEDSVWASENIVVDWNLQAVRTAKSYIESAPFSRKSLVKQLESEGFTNEEANHAATEVGL